MAAARGRIQARGAVTGRAQAARRARWAFFLLAPPAYGLLALVFAMDANWDLRNYHYYNAYAFLGGREDHDVLVASVPTFFNPLLDVPFFLAAEAWPARLVGFLLGTVQGLNALPLFGIGYALIVVDDPLRRVGIAAGFAVLGLAGAITLSLVGTTFYDNVVTLGPLAALCIVMTRHRDFGVARAGRACGLALLAGVLCGIAAGFKQPSAIYGVGVGAAVLVVPASWPRRVALAAAFAVGAISGVLVSGGWWMWHLWSALGNPLFPFYNDLFGSPMALASDYKKVFYLPDSLLARLFFPITYTLDPSVTSDAAFRDHRILACFVLVPLAAIATLSRNARDTLLAWSIPTRILMIFAAVTYAVWVAIFGVYRYALALEMLAPLIILACFSQFPGGWRWRAVGAGVVILLVVATARPTDWGRVAWADKWVRTEAPPLDRAGETIVLLAGHEPFGFLVPGFPPETRFLRIDGGFTTPREPGVGFNTVMRETIGAHQGPLYVLTIPTDRSSPEASTAAYGLTVDWSDCRVVTSTIGWMPYELCAVRRSG
jgi:hypothetical protein